jgi:hypothetical protein
MTRIDKQAVKRLSKTMHWYGNHWKVGDIFSEQRAADCDRVAATLLTLLAALTETEIARDFHIKSVDKVVEDARSALDAAEARERAAVAAAYEKAAASLEERGSDGWAEHVMADYASVNADAIRALSDTDALAEYVEKERTAERERCAKIGYRICAETRHVTLADKVDAAIRQETNDG